MWALFEWDGERVEGGEQEKEKSWNGYQLLETEESSNNIRSNDIYTLRVYFSLSRK